MNKFLLFCSPRTGSTTVRNFLADLGTYVIQEPFREEKYETDYDIVIETGHIFFNLQAQGIKHLHTHITERNNLLLLQFAQEEKISIVFLRRRNFAAAALSKYFALATGIWEVNQDNAEDKIFYSGVTEKMNIHPDIIRNEIQEMAEAEDIYLRKMAAADAITLYYEDLFAEPDKRDKLLALLLNYVIPPLCKKTWPVMSAQHFNPGRKQNTLEVYQNRIENITELIETFGIKL